jgi:beta-lactamase regulating signal transducer with metallopeptidase domain
MTSLVEVGLWNAAASAVLALLAAAVARLCRRPALAHTLWLLVLLKLLTPPLVPFSVTWPAAEGPGPPAVEEGPAPAVVMEPEPPPAEADEADPILVEPSPPATASSPVAWQWWAGAVWLAGSALWAGWVALHVVRFRRVLRLARPAPAPLREEAEGLARRMGLRRCPDVWLVDGAVSPMVWALGRPRLLFPSGLLDRLNGSGRAALLAHELAHLRRRDHWVRLLELAATGLYWWLPVLWWARRELHEAEEQCCDAWGVWALGGDGRPYALALLQAVAFVSRSRLPLPAGASGGVGQLSHLKRRLEMVMQGKSSRSLSWAGLGVVCGLGLLLPLFPAHGQAPPRAPAPEPPPALAAPEDDRDREIAEVKRALERLIAQKERENRVKAAQDAGAMRLNEANPERQLQEVEAAIQKKEKEVEELKAMAKKLRAALREREARPGALAPLSPANRVPPSHTAPRTPEGRVDELEKKLDRLQKQMDELMEFMKRGRTGNAPTPRAGGPTPPPADTAPSSTPRPSRTAPPTGGAPPADPAAPTAPGAAPARP